MSSAPTLSVIVPCFNEEEVIQHTHARLAAALKAITGDFEIIYVDDGSRDRTAELLRQIQQDHAEVRVLRDRKSVV